MWIVIILIVIGLLVFLKFQADTQKVKERNMTFGGLKNLFPQWTDFAKENEMELVKDNGTDMEFRKRVDSDSNSFFEFYLAIQSKFTNIATGWVIHSNGKKIKSNNVEFGKNPNEETVEKIFELIAKDLKSKGAFNICRYKHTWEYHGDNFRTCKNCFTTQSKLLTSGQWMEF